MLCRTSAVLGYGTLTSGQGLSDLKGSGIFSVAFSPNGRVLAFGFGGWNDAGVAVWDFGSGQQPRILKEHVGSFSSAFFSPDGKTVAIGSPASSGWSFNRTTLSGATLWDVAAGQGLNILKEPNTLMLSLNAKAPVSWVVGEKTIKWLDPTSWRETGVLTSASSISNVDFSRNGTMILTRNDKTLTLWDAASGRELHTLYGTVGFALSIIFSPDEKTIASVSGRITLWDFASRESPRTLSANAFPAKSLALSPQGDTVAVWGDDWRAKGLKLWDIVSGDEPRTLRLNEDPAAQHHARKSNTTMLLTVQPSVAFSPDGKEIVVSSPDNRTVTLWDVASGKRLRTLNGQTEDFGGIVYSPDGKMIAAFSGNTIRLWDAASGLLRRTLKGYEGGGLVFSPDNEKIASWSADFTIKMWNITSGWELHTLEGHGGAVTGIAFAPDSKTIASSSSDHTIKLWVQLQGSDFAPWRRVASRGGWPFSATTARAATRTRRHGSMRSGQTKPAIAPAGTAAGTLRLHSTGT